MPRAAAVLGAASCAVSVAGHGAMLSPRPRNSIDYLVDVNDLPVCVNVTGAACHAGQAAFWYSQGCSIGCPACDHTSGRVQADLCGLGKSATVNDPGLRTLNRGAAAGGPDDIYKHNPWRAPGSAPVADPCGLAGGTPWGPNAPEEGVYINTTLAHHGMHGTDLPEMPTGTVWTIGGKAEVTWMIRNNHGGGYQYRVCPISEPLTEDCFQRHPLEFVRDGSALALDNGTRLPVRGVFVDKGTSPEGSTWARIPIPPTWLGPRCLEPTPPLPPSRTDACEAWEADLVDGPCKPCPMSPGSDCSRCDNNPRPGFEPPCWDGNLSDGTGLCEASACPAAGGGPGCAAILDVVKVPAELPPGKYVLGFRYDCEATAQVWSNCADITLVA